VANWLEFTLVPSLITITLVMVVLWPTRTSGRRLLQRWGIPAPAAPQTAAAVRYLFHRRILFVLLALVVPTLIGWVWPPSDSWLPGSTLLPLVAALLIAELVAVLRPVRGVRVASLERRSGRDLVPGWAIAVTVVLTALDVGLAAAVLSVESWARRYVVALPQQDAADSARLLDPVGWLLLAGVAVVLAVVAAVVFLAARRPAVSDSAVDAALRIRTARVAVGIGFGSLGGLVFEAYSRLSSLWLAGAEASGDLRPPGWLTEGLLGGLEIFAFVVFVGSVGCWIFLATPKRRSLAPATT
jgi:hypothetical protein